MEKLIKARIIKGVHEMSKINQYKDYVSGQNASEKVLSWIETNLANYLKKAEKHGAEPEVSEVEHILDFLMSDAAPKRIKYMSYDEAKAGAERWTERLKKKAGDIVETEQDVETFMCFDDGMKIVRLVGKNAFLREGNLMSHCVGSYYDKDGSEVYSLRDSKNKPHATMEVVRGDETINQVKGKGNGSIHPRYINYVLQFLNKLGMEVRDSEMEHLGYTKPPEVVETLLSQYFEQPKYVIYNNKQYLYKYQDFKRKQ